MHQTFEQALRREDSDATGDIRPAKAAALAARGGRAVIRRYKRAADKPAPWVVWVSVPSEQHVVGRILAHEDGAPLLFQSARSAWRMAERCLFRSETITVDTSLSVDLGEVPVQPVRCSHGTEARNRDMAGS